MNKRTSRLSLLLVGLTLLLFAAAHFATSGAGVAAQSNKVSSLWDTETILTVDAIAPHFDYQGGPDNFSFSFIGTDRGALRVARVEGESVEFQTVAYSPESGGLTGIGHDLEGSLLSYSLPKEDGSSAVALARWSDFWTSETVVPVNGGGSTFIANSGVPAFPFDSALFYSGPKGLFVTREDAGGKGWSSTAVDPEAKADTSISLAFDRMDFASLAYCAHTGAGDSLKAAWLDYDAELWKPFTLVNQTCTEVKHFGAWVGSSVGQFFFSTDDHLKELSGFSHDLDISIIDSAAEGGWIGRGLSAGSDIVDFWMAYTAYDPASSETSLHVAFSTSDGRWQTIPGPAGNFAAWTHLEEFHKIDDQLVKISVLYYDISQGALKRATWPPAPDIFFPIIRQQ